MRNRDVMPVNADRVRVETWGMSAEQFGAFFRLLMDTWCHGPIRYDDEQLALVAGVSLRRWLKIGPYVLRFLVIREGYVTFENGRYIGKTEREPLPLRIRHEVIERDGFVCSYCGTTEGAFEIDHIIPVSKGGENDLSNLCIACARCNRSKRAQLVSEWRR